MPKEFKRGNIIKDSTVYNSPNYLVVKEENDLYRCLDLTTLSVTSIAKKWINEFYLVRDDIDINKVIEFLQTGDT